MKNNHHIRILIFLGLLASACSGKKQTIENTEEGPIFEEAYFLSEAPQKEKIIIYQMMTRLFGNTNSTNKTFGSLKENGTGTFADITPKALEEIRSLGASHVWYTGVLEHATMINQKALGIPLDDVDVVKGRAGSPYAIKDYYDVNPYLAQNPEARLEEFGELVARSHKAGLKVLIDFVPNHVARSYHSDAKPLGVVDFGENDDTSLAFSPTNNFYYLPGKQFVVPAEHNPGGPDNQLQTEDGIYAENPPKATGNDGFTATPQNWDWFETVKLNYGVDYQNERQTHFDPVPETWLQMHEILKYWATKGVDGFRCDMAEMVPVEFWEWVIPKIKTEFGEEFTFVAEIYNPAQYANYLDLGQFDYLYDKVQLYDSLKHIIQGKGSPAGLSAIWQSLRGYNGRMLRFLENHDEQRIASPGFAGDAWKAIPMMTVSATWHSGPTLVYFGQEVGEPGEGLEGFQGEDGRTTIFDFWGVPQHQKWMNDGAFDGGGLNTKEKELRDFYSTLLTFSREEPAFAKGDFYDLDSYLRTGAADNYPTQAYTYLRHYQGKTFLVAANFSDKAINLSFTVPQDVAEGWSLSDEPSDPVVCETPFFVGHAPLGAKKVQLLLPAYGAAILANAKN